MGFHLGVSLPRFGGLGGVDGVNSQLLGQIFQILDGFGLGLVVRHLADISVNWIRTNAVFDSRLHNNDS